MHATDSTKPYEFDSRLEADRMGHMGYLYEFTVLCVQTGKIYSAIEYIYRRPDEAT